MSATIRASRGKGSPPGKGDTVPHTLDNYFRHLARRNLRATYIYAQRGTLKRLGLHLDSVDLLDAGTDDLTAYLDSRKLCAGARAVEIAHLRAFYTWAQEEGLIEANPTLRVVKPRRHRGVPRPMPETDFRRALVEAPPRVGAILAFAGLAGLRACEIAQLRADDLDDDIILIREGKGGSSSTVPLAPQLAEYLGRCELPAWGWLFPRQDGRGHVSRSMICHLANTFLRELGIHHPLHSARHLFGTAVYRKTLDLRLTQELLRHQSPASTAIYTQIVPDRGAAALASLPRLV